MLPPNIILIILAFYFLNENNDKYYDKNRCVSVSQVNNFNLLVILILIIINYSNSIPVPNSTYINANENSEQELTEDSKAENDPLYDDSSKPGILKDPPRDSSEVPSEDPSKDSLETSPKEEFTYANKEVKSNTPDSSLSKYINNDYQGATVTALLSNETTVTGEVIFAFEDIVSLKTKDKIIFISSKDIVSFC